MEVCYEIIKYAIKSIGPDGGTKTKVSVTSSLMPGPMID